MMNKKHYDVIIIGAGITGSLIGHYLSKYDLDIAILEKESDVAEGASGANSAIIHAGDDPEDNTLKAKYNLQGSLMYEDLCQELKVDYQRIGGYVFACGDEEEKTLEILKERCINRNIPYELIDRDELLKREKNISDLVTKALYLPSTAIITPWEVCIAACEEFILNNNDIYFNHQVNKIRKNENGFIISCGDEEFECDYLINCAGVYADEISKMLGIQKYHIRPRKGQYYILDHTGDKLVNKVIYPTPSSKGKGVLAAPTIHNNILIGPDSEFVDDKDDLSSDEGLDYVKKEINKTIKNIPMDKIIHTFVGLRPSSDIGDFVVGEDDDISNFYHVAGIESPGLSSAPAIAKDIGDQIISKTNKSLKEKYIRREKQIILNRLSDEEKDQLIKENSDYGKLICRCEKISLGEIKDSINRKCGARSIQGVKRRCRPGMGRCQGGFCEVEVLKILSECLKEDYDDVYQKDIDSKVLVSKAKELL